MPSENRQSTQIQTLDGYPFTQVGGGSGTGRLTGGQNAAQFMQQIEGWLNPTSGATATNYYQFCRVPDDCILKSVEVTQLGGTVTTFTVDVTLGISDSTIDGTPFGLQVVPSALATPPANAFVANPGLTTTGLSGANALFAHNPAVITTANAGIWTDVTLLNSAAPGFGPAGMEQPLWQAAGYTAPTGGFFDIVMLETATSSFTGTMSIGMRVRFATPSG